MPRVPRPAIAAVIFDLIGTLVGFSAERLDDVFVDMAATLDLSIDDYRRACAAVRSDWEAGAFSSIEAHAEHICRSLDRSPDPARVRRVVERYLEFTRHALTPREGALETLSRVRERGLRIGLITNCSSEIPLVWPSTSLASLVDRAVFSCQESLRKPDPRLYAIACGRLGVSPEQCLYVGDGGSRELSGARACGMAVVQLCAPDEAAEDAARLGREAWNGPRIERLEEVLGVLARACLGWMDG
jgi:putative hydrolase of the HAD superfamily